MYVTCFCTYLYVLTNPSSSCLCMSVCMKFLAHPSLVNANDSDSTLNHMMKLVGVSTQVMCFGAAYHTHSTHDQKNNINTLLLINSMTNGKYSENPSRKDGGSHSEVWQESPICTWGWLEKALLCVSH